MLKDIKRSTVGLKLNSLQTLIVLLQLLQVLLLLSGLPDDLKAQTEPIRKALADKNFDLAVALYDDLVFDGVL